MTTPRFQIAVLDRGFVYVGLCTMQADGGLTVTQAQCIRRWGTSAGLGELAMKGPQPRTVLEPVGTLHAPASAIMHRINLTKAAHAAFAATAPGAFADQVA